jgi:hypothetical protein
MSNDPLTITLDRIVELLRGLGVEPADPRDLKSVFIRPGAVEVVRYRKDARGKHYIAGDGLATQTTVIAILDSPPEPRVLDTTTLGDAEPKRQVTY